MGAYERLEARGFVAQCSHLEEVRAALARTDAPVTLYVGFDPTASSLHVGHLMQVMVMANLQREGHRVIAVVGGGTARVGDPSGRTELRQMLTDEQIAQNTASLKRQLERFLVLDGERGILVDNAEWLLKLQYIPFLREIGRHFSVNVMLAAESYKQRLERGLSFIEFNYQILQAYDFLELFRRHGCRLQIGGNDQWGNIVAGVDLVRRMEQTEVWALTTPLLTTASGAKMGKTAKGAVWLDAELLAPFDFWQYWYNTDDRDVARFLKLYTFLSDDKIAEMEALRGAELNAAKRLLANEVTALVHGPEASRAAEAGAAAMTGAVAAEELPTTQLAGPTRLCEALKLAGVVQSLSEARRLVQQGGVSIDGVKATDGDAPLDPAPGSALVVRVGKRRAVRFVS